MALIQPTDNTKKAINYEQILSIFTIFETESEANRGKNQRIINFEKKMKHG